MPESAFIWYHADPGLRGRIRDWQNRLAETVGVHGRLLVRCQGGQTTFMEIYEHVESGLVERIETLAERESCFAGIRRRCESFVEVMSDE